jgi:molybdopterin converting factor small subunit
MTYAPKDRAMKIKIILSGRNYDLAQFIPEALELAENATLDDALAALAKLLPEGRDLPATGLVAIAGKHVGTVAAHPATPLGDGDEVVIVAPVAGG